MSFFQNMIMTSLTSLNETNEISSWENKPYLPKWQNQKSPQQADYGLTSIRKKKRTRTSFTGQQLQYLEDAYLKNHYCYPTERRKLADDLKLTDKHIKIWFQNRRMKSKKEAIDSTLNASEVSRSTTSTPVSKISLNLTDNSDQMSEELYSPVQNDYMANQYELPDVYVTPVHEENAFSDNYNQEYWNFHNPISNYGTNTNLFLTEYYPEYSEAYTPSYTCLVPENNITINAISSNFNWQGNDEFSHIWQ